MLINNCDENKGIAKRAVIFFFFSEDYDQSLVVILASNHKKIKEENNLKSQKFQKISGNPDALATPLTLSLCNFANELQWLFKV